ncbi:hypothetical protein ID866_5878, partial [Astraeus odoratus]
MATYNPECLFSGISGTHSRTLVLPVPVLLSFQKLTTLSLRGLTNDWQFKPNSIHLPLLGSLELGLTHSRELMQAIVAPNLSYFHYTPCAIDPDSVTVFNNLPAKFPNVQRLCFDDAGSIPRVGPRVANAEWAIAICKAFPHVRHAELGATHITGFFGSETQSPVDLWENLESLDIHQISPDSRPGSLVGWLIRRASEGKKKLDVILSEFYLVEEEPELNGVWLSGLYEALYPYCTLEIRNFPLKLDLTVCSSPQHADIVNTSYKYPRFIRLIDQALQGAGRVAGEEG